MIIGERLAESHEHASGVCLYQYERVINGKNFLFTNVNIPEGSVYKVTERVNGVPTDRHNIKVSRNGK